MVGRADGRTDKRPRSECVICALCSQHLSQQISQLLSELEENRGFHFMQQEDDLAKQVIDEKARSVYKKILLPPGRWSDLNRV